MNTIECIALYGIVNWKLDDVQKYIAVARSIFDFLKVPATHYGYCEEPFQKYGSRIGSVRNVQKKVDALYSSGLRLKSLEFFSLPKGYNFQYADYHAYLARGEDYLVIAYDPDYCNFLDVDELLSEMCKHITAVWGERFHIERGEQPLTRCMDQYANNPLGEKLSHDFYEHSIHVVNQFNFTN